MRIKTKLSEDYNNFLLEERIVSSKIPFGINLYHIEISQLVCQANQ